MSISVAGFCTTFFAPAGSYRVPATAVLSERERERERD